MTDGPQKQREPMIVPCVACARTGVSYGSRGRCTTCVKRDWRLKPENRRKDRAVSQVWKAANRERNRARDRAYKAAVRAGEQPVQPRATPDELIVCRECGEQMLKRSPSGACGFCELEAAA